MPYLKKEAPNPEPIDCKILTAALKLFVESGYHNVSIHHIQKQADVSIGSIYKYFGGKEGIAKVLYQHVLTEIDELISTVVDDIDSPIEQCNEIIKQLFEHTETHHHIIAFVFHAKHADFLPNESQMCDAAPFTKIRKIIARGIEKGLIKQTNTWIATSLVFGGAMRMIQLRLDGVIEEPLNDYSTHFINALWSGLRSDVVLKIVDDNSAIAS